MCSYHTKRGLQRPGCDSNIDILWAYCMANGAVGAVL